MIAKWEKNRLFVRCGLQSPFVMAHTALNASEGRKFWNDGDLPGLESGKTGIRRLFFWHTLTCLPVLLWDNGNEMRRIGIYRGVIDREKSRFSVCFSGISWILTAKNVFFTAFGIFSLHFYRVEIRNNGKFAQNISKWAFTSIYKHTQEYANISVWGLYL